jgi:hypothetical protein
MQFACSFVVRFREAFAESAQLEQQADRLLLVFRHYSRT